MNIKDYLNSESVILGAGTISKTDALEKLIDAIDATGNLADKELFKKAILDREAIGSTGVADGVAIPHAKSDTVTKATIAALTAESVTGFSTFDNSETKLVLMVAAPVNKPGEENIHLDILQLLSNLLSDRAVIDNLVKAKSSEAFDKVLIDAYNAFVA
ncbi:MAG: fructose PTS transporter subunit IIA [Clostridiales Family XIII bacterium]|jgi:PTS system fructose-specific IIC component|nr:fructose PTS transporter subunit IIA [Clostridiales Family XIII bacterium]